MTRLASVTTALVALGCGTAPIEVALQSGQRLLRVPQDHPTIQAAVDAAGAGDVVLVAPGVYRERVQIQHKAVTLASHFLASREASHVGRTVIEGGSGTGPIVAVRFGGSESTRIVGFTIRGGAAAGVDVRRSSVEILDNEISNNGKDGVGFSDSQALLRGNTFAGNGDDGIDSDGANALRIEANRFLRNGQDGIEVRLEDYAGEPLEIRVRENVFRENNAAIQLIDYPSVTPRTFWIERNVFVGNAIGIGCMPGGETEENFGGASLAEPVHVVHNTFVGNRHGLTGGDDMAVVNNVFASNLGGAFRRLAGRSVAAHNLLWRNGGRDGDAPPGVQPVVRADPRLDSEQRLGEGSPAIDAGTASFVHGGVELIAPGSWLGAAPDLGAFERE